MNHPNSIQACVQQHAYYVINPVNVTSGGDHKSAAVADNALTRSACHMKIILLCNSEFR